MNASMVVGLVVALAMIGCGGAPGTIDDMPTVSTPSRVDAGRSGSVTPRDAGAPDAPSLSPAPDAAGDALISASDAGQPVAVSDASGDAGDGDDGAADTGTVSYTACMTDPVGGSVYIAICGTAPPPPSWSTALTTETISFTGPTCDWANPCLCDATHVPTMPCQHGATCWVGPGPGTPKTGTCVECRYSAAPNNRGVICQ